MLFVIAGGKLVPNYVVFPTKWSVGAINLLIGIRYSLQLVKMLLWSTRRDNLYSSSHVICKIYKFSLTSVLHVLYIDFSYGMKFLPVTLCLVLRGL